MTSQPLALLIDADAASRRLLRDALETAGFATGAADSLDAGLQSAETLKPDIVLLDLRVVGGACEDLILALRQWTDAPIVALSDSDDEAEKVAALDAGADDHVRKPISTSELLARMRAMLRRRDGPREGRAVWRSGDVSIDFSQRQVSVGGAAIALTPREYDVLRVLAQHAGRVVTHREILETAWRKHEGGDFQHVRVVIGQVRRKLEAERAAPLILTEQGVGYRLRVETPP